MTINELLTLLSKSTDIEIIAASSWRLVKRPAELGDTLLVEHLGDKVGKERLTEAAAANFFMEKVSQIAEPVDLRIKIQ